MTMTDTESTTENAGELRSHGAKFSKRHLAVMADLFTEEAERLGKAPVELTVLDPFAGVGTIHELPFATVGIELEPEWARQHPDTLVGDARKLPIPDGSIDCAGTSPTFANRMSDLYDGSNDRCTTCAGMGCGLERCERFHLLPMTETDDAHHPCTECTGTGRRPSKRNTYAIHLGRRPSPGNSGAMPWGKPYRELHRLAWTELHRVLREPTDDHPGGLAVVNLSNHQRTVGPAAKRVRTFPPVVEFHLMTLFRVGFFLESASPLEVRRYAHGANRDTRTAHEFMLVVRKGRPLMKGE